MRLLAIGRLKDEALRRLCLDYARRLPWPIETVEIEDRKRAANAAERKGREARLLLAAVPEDACLIALDERGEALSSAGLAEALRALEGTAGEVVFAIGGADGLDPSVLSRARRTLSLGPMTWPHRLVRVMLMEQLYRASTILRGHPYHRV